ncbi:hypothetical protein VHEMI05576 [[Torrubiella] hemipterigena]|uniref:Uncharacterized protein n=1 Tax=[Torrubiella] hemipterigena TaxID=1531966 RepID=A0A0A1SYD3_9HYPO|nr:hypothetical protein VHEMI05576 [[Torrubiella] hemipterigena]
MAFLEDPRLRQRWNQITHDAEAATENAAAGIWSLKEHYITPCFGYVTDSFEQCTTVCFGDPEERRRRQRERALAIERAEFGFDFYDDWYDEHEQGGSFFGTWAGEDWDRLLAGTGSQKQRAPGAETTDQPRRKRGMSYGTRGSRRKSGQQDPTIIPSTQPIGFLSKLPWKMGGTLRYKPSAADLQDHPGKIDNPETEPLLGSDDESDYGELIMPRQRSNTNGSGGTTDSFRSRGDLFPSDGEGDEDAVALDDDVTFDMVRKDDRSTRSDRTRSSKGKRPVDQFAGSRTVSRTTLNSNSSYESLAMKRSTSSLLARTSSELIPTMTDLRLEEQRVAEEEEDEVIMKREAAAVLAAERGLDTKAPPPPPQAVQPDKSNVEPDEEFPRLQLPTPALQNEAPVRQSRSAGRRVSIMTTPKPAPQESTEFFPARLPHFGQ